MYTIVYTVYVRVKGEHGGGLYIEAWEWDDGNIEHLATRGITPELVEDKIWGEAPKYIADRHNRAASHLMIGPDLGRSVLDYLYFAGG